LNSLNVERDNWMTDYPFGQKLQRTGKRSRLNWIEF